MRILITGGRGQLGRALQRSLGDHELTVIGRAGADVTDRRAVTKALHEAQADLVIHCAAYTDVDGCTRDPQLAYSVNGLGTQNVALACLESDAAMLHVSTNEVFDGKNPAGYEEWMPLKPPNPYARSKAAAEFHVRSLLRHHYVVRTAWLYAPGGSNFVQAILRRARQAGQIRVVADEIGNPTYVKDLARAIARLIATHQYGTYHFVNEGACSRWEFAGEILRLANLNHVQNTPILSTEFRRASTPPPYGMLHNVAGAALGIRLRPWQEALAEFMAEEGNH